MMQTLNDHRSSPGKRTVIVLGCGRGGTSAIAGVLRELGVGFPEQTHPLKHESSPIVYQGQSVDPAGTVRNLRALDARHELWGWKSPGDLFSVHSWISMVRNPCFVVIFRHPLATIRSIVKHEMVDFEVAADHVTEVNAELGRFIMASPFPMAVLSYEDLCSTPRTLVPQIGAWLGMAPNEDRLTAAADFVAGGDKQYRALKQGREHPAGAFSDEELGGDRQLAQRAMYGLAQAALATGIAELTADSQRARAVIRHLEDQLPYALAEPHQADMPAIPEPANTASDPSSAYHTVRELFANISLLRLRLQQRMDTLAERVDASRMQDAD